MIVMKAMRRWLLLGASATLGFSACASDPGLKAQVRDLSKQMAELTRKQDDALRKQDDLENRVFLLTDQVETQKVSQTRRGAAELPVVTLRPPPPPRDTAPEVSVPVEFAGPARSDQPDHIRPMLRAEGDFYAESVPQATLPGAQRRTHSQAQAQPQREEAGPAAAPSPGSATASADAGARPQGDIKGVVLAREAHGASRRRIAAPLSAIPPSGDNLGVVPVPPVSVVARKPPGEEGGPKEEAAAPVARVVASAEKRTAPAERGAVAGEPLTLYRIAYDRLRGGDYPGAERDMREFVRRFPRHDYADNAQYWLGETFYARKSYGDAATAFRAVVERWPSGNKAPDALLKLGFSLLMMNEMDRGQKVLLQVTEHYPRTDAARLAEKRLSELKGTK